MCLVSLISSEPMNYIIFVFISYINLVLFALDVDVNDRRTRGSENTPLQFAHKIGVNK